MTWRALSHDAASTIYQALPAGLKPALEDASSASSQGLMDSARHVIGCHSTQETWVQHACGELASTIHQSLPEAPWRPRRPSCAAHRGRHPPCSAQLTLKAKVESGSSYVRFKRVRSGAFSLGLIGSTCTALPRGAAHAPSSFAPAPCMGRANPPGRSSPPPGSSRG
jgi:hypothetical protein